MAGWIEIKIKPFRIDHQAKEGDSEFGVPVEMVGDNPHIGHNRTGIGKNRGVQSLQDQSFSAGQLKPPGVVDIAAPQRFEALDGDGREKKIKGTGGIHGTKRDDQEDGATATGYLRPLSCIFSEAAVSMSMPS